MKSTFLSAGFWGEIVLGSKFKRFQPKTFKLFAVCLVAVLAIPAVVFACGQTEPAVSDINAKISVEGECYDSERSLIGLGSATIPLGHSFGSRADGDFGRIDDKILLGGGAHLFARDPSKYLLGVYNSYNGRDSNDIWRTAMEAELYQDRFSLTGLAGFESFNVHNTSGGLLVLNTDNDQFFDHADLPFYPDDDLEIYIGDRYVNETSLDAAVVEHLLSGLGLPIIPFAQGKSGASVNFTFNGGAKITWLLKTNNDDLVGNCLDP